MIDRFAVTNTAFAAFVAATGHVSDAERYGWSFVFGAFLPDDFPATRGVVGAEWWRQVYGADWRHPDGPQSTIEDRMDHPVVHVSWNDAQRVLRAGPARACQPKPSGSTRHGPAPWALPVGRRARARGRTSHERLPRPLPARESLHRRLRGDGPGRRIPPNTFGLHNVTGNVWEWCHDWHDSSYYEHGPRVNPMGPADGELRVQRGGSYLCHESYCRRYRVSARVGSEPESSTGNVGFRVARDVDEAHR